MKTLQSIVSDVCTQAIQNEFGDKALLFLPAEVTQSTQEQFGHYQCNTALRLGKALGQNPREVANLIVGQFPEDLFEKVEVAGPGFINITLKNSFLSEELNTLFSDEHLGVPLPEKKKRVIVEFSSPNVAKELHVGHLRSTIIGDSIARLLEFLGHDVIRLNHVGDWGTQFGMLITYMKEEVPEIFKETSGATLSELMHWYKEAKKRFDDDEAFKERSRNQVVALQGGEEAALFAWKAICEISRRGFEEIYKILDVKLEERGESFYNNMLQPVVEEFKERGIAEKSDGALCVFLDGYKNKEGNPLPMIIQKSDGGYNYTTTDLAALKYRIETDKADRIICVTDAGQRIHFEMVFKAGEKAGIFDPTQVEINHVTFGVVLGPDGKKFKTRSGETEKLHDLLEGAVSHAKELMEERAESPSDEMAEIMGIDAVKYSDLSSNRNKDYVFSYDRMLRFEGNTAVFLLYAFVRIQGLKRKVGKEIETITDPITLEHESELRLALHLRQFGELLLVVEKDLLPHRLCEYLFELAERFNAFFRDCRVEGDPQEGSRLKLCHITERVLGRGMDLLGLKTLDRM